MGTGADCVEAPAVPAQAELWIVPIYPFDPKCACSSNVPKPELVSWSLVDVGLLIELFLGLRRRSPTLRAQLYEGYIVAPTIQMYAHTIVTRPANAAESLR